uniref:hypothetical protein n=1 Tax=Aliarcobacter sp. TaxID=2321116 RepID=UPI004048AB63
MIILGDEFIPFEDVCFIKNIEDIKVTKANSTIIFNYDKNILKYCFENEISSAVIVRSIKESIYCNSLNVKYIISEKKLAKKIQKIADNYMYDSKNIAIIQSNNEFQKIAKKEIDGVIYKKIIN